MYSASNAHVGFTMSCICYNQCCCPQGKSSKTNLQVLFLVLGPQVLVIGAQVLGPQSLVLEESPGPQGSSPLITKSSKIVKALRKVLVLEDQFTRPCPWTSSPCPWITSPCPRALSPCPQTLSPWQHHWLQLSTQIAISSKAGHVVKSQNNTHIYIFKKTERTHVLHKTYW